MDHQPLDRILQLPCWSGRVDPAPLLGGITNKNYLVADRGQKFVVRLGQDIPIHGVMRFNELAASRAAFEAGVSPEVVYAEPGALVLRYIEGRALSPELVRDPELLPGVVDLIKRCHEQVPRHLRGPSLVFWVFQVIRGYATELQACASPHVEALPQLIERAERLEREVGPVSIVFGHNDLLAANFIDDGKRLWLIDWDYAGFNSPLFDLGGLASNSELGRGSRPGSCWSATSARSICGLQRRFAAMKCASLLRETMWSMVSEVHSKIQFDYGAYTSDYLARFERAYDEFTELDELSGSVR